MRVGTTQATSPWPTPSWIKGTYREIWDPDEPPHTKYPPVFSVVLAWAMLLGVKSWGGLKVVPAFSVVLAVAFTFLWARDRKGLLPGLVVALLLGLSESVLYYTQWILSDPTFLALTMAALWAFTAALGAEEGESEDPQRRGRGEASGWAWNGHGGSGVLHPIGRAPLGCGHLALARIPEAMENPGLFRAVRYPGTPLVAPGAVGGSEYVSEFWLVDPYQPHLGTVGFGGLLERVGENLSSYVFGIMPAGIVGEMVPLLPPPPRPRTGFGGPGRVDQECGRRVGLAELFLPLYFGLVLLWPQPGRGTVFPFPFFPSCSSTAVVALRWLAGVSSLGGRRAVGAILFLVWPFRPDPQWNRMAAEAGSCRGLTRMEEPSDACPRHRGSISRWRSGAGRNLPDGASVTTRKPRIFFLMSGVKASPIPIVGGPTNSWTDQSRGSQYLTLDLLDGMSGYYVYPVVRERLSSFLWDGGGRRAGRHPLLGILLANPEGDPEVEGPEVLSDARQRCSEPARGRQNRSGLADSAPGLEERAKWRSRSCSSGCREGPGPRRRRCVPPALRPLHDPSRSTERAGIFPKGAFEPANSPRPPRGSGHIPGRRTRLPGGWGPRGSEVPPGRHREGPGLLRRRECR